MKMFKCFFIILGFFFLTFNGVYSQPLLDAIEFNYHHLRDDSLRDAEYYKILYKYAPNEVKNETPEELIGYFQNDDNNPFLFRFLTNPQAGSLTQKLAGVSIPKPSSVSFGNLDVTNFAFGLTDFLIERAKTELNIAFFRRLKEALDDEYLDVMFPHSKKVLDAIDIEIYQYNHYLNALRTAFANDLRMLSDRLPEVIDLLSEKGVIKVDHQDEYHLLHLLAQMSGWVQEKLHPGEILSRIPASEHFQALGKSSKQYYKDAFSIIASSSLFSESFRNTTGDQYWVGEGEFVQLKDEKTLKIYLGLLYEVSKTSLYSNIKFNISGSEQSLTEILKEIGKDWSTDKITLIVSFLQEIGYRTQRTANAIENLNRLKKELDQNANISNSDKRKRMLEAGLDVYNSLANLLKVSYQIDKLSFMANKPIYTVSPKAKEIIDFLEIGGHIGTQLLNEQYAGAVANIAIILKIDSTSNFAGQFLKYGTFMAKIVAAETPEDAKAVIETIALPPGSYIVKRESTFNVAINGYIGAFYGQERIDGVDNTGFNNLALTAPVGISFSFGNITRQSKYPWSFSLFTPIIDLGAIASFRLKVSDASTQMNEPETLPTINLKYIIAPGLFAEIGIGRTPLSLGFGGQFGPRLRKVNPTANPPVEIGDTYFRLGCSLKVDIPLLNLYNKPAK